MSLPDSIPKLPHSDAILSGGLMEFDLESRTSKGAINLLLCRLLHVGQLLFLDIVTTALFLDITTLFIVLLQPRQNSGVHPSVSCGPGCSF
jgi:hypothetical protein